MTTVTLGVDQPAFVGRQTRFWPTDIDPNGVRIVVDGEILGGPQDGEHRRRAFELAVGSSADLGALLKISLLRVSGQAASFAVFAPGHVQVGPARDATEPRSD
jgi:hypothetical protein